MVANYGDQLMLGYRNWAQLNDTFEDYTMGGNLNPAMSFNSSIFPNSFGGGGYFGGGAGDQAYYNMGRKERLEYDTDMQLKQSAAQTALQKQQMENSVYLAKTKRSLILKSTASEDSVKRAAGILHDLSVNDRQDQIPSAYANLKAAVKEQLEEGGGEATEDQIKTTADRLYAEATGQRIKDDLDQHGAPQFIHGLEQGAFGLGWLLTDGKTAKDNEAEVTGQPVSKADQFANIAGIVVSAGLSLVALPLLLKGGGKIGKFALTKSAESWKDLFKKAPKVPEAIPAAA